MHLSVLYFFGCLSKPSRGFPVVSSISTVAMVGRAILLLTASGLIVTDPVLRFPLAKPEPHLQSLPHNVQSDRVNGHAYNVEALEGLDGVDEGPVFLVEEEEELLPVVFQEDSVEPGSERVQFMAVKIFFHENI